MLMTTVLAQHTPVAAFTKKVSGNDRHILDHANITKLQLWKNPTRRATTSGEHCKEPIVIIAIVINDVTLSC